MRRAQREIALTHRQVRAEIEQLGTDLQHVFEADRKRPGNVVIEEKLDKLRHDIQQWTQVSKAKHSEDLGGMVELPLDHYPVELGLGRAGSGLQLEREDFITLGVAAAIIVVSCLAITWYNLWREDVDFALSGPAKGQIAVTFRNDSSFTANFFGPWPESDAGLPRHSYGVQLYCRPADGKEFQDCTSIREVWGYQGQVISPIKPVQVEPGVEVTIILLVPALEKIYGSPIAELKITAGNRGDRGDFKFTVPLSKP